MMDRRVVGRRRVLVKIRIVLKPRGGGGFLIVHDHRGGHAGQQLLRRLGRRHILHTVGEGRVEGKLFAEHTLNVIEQAGALRCRRCLPQPFATVKIFDGILHRRHTGYRMVQLARVGDMGGTVELLQPYTTTRQPSRRGRILAGDEEWGRRRFLVVVVMIVV